MPNVFISWSGPSSKAVAEVLYEWLPVALQTIKPFLSTEDLKKGGRWQNDLTVELAKDSFGILCLTPSNLTAPWILFEAGALSKSLGDGQVAPFLVGVKPSDLPPPLTQFNAVFAEKDDIKRLLRAINDRVPSETIQAERIDRAIDAYWSQMVEALKSAEEQPLPTKAADDVEPTEMDSILQELLVLNRQQTQILTKIGLTAEIPSTHLRADLEATRQKERSILTDFLRQVWVLTSYRGADAVPPALEYAMSTVDRMSSYISDHWGIVREHRRRRRLPTEQKADAPAEQSTVLTFGYSGLGEPPNRELADRISSRIEVRRSVERGGFVDLTFSEPPTGSQYQEILRIAHDLAFDEISP